MKKTLFVFDFDGVLCIPWTRDHFLNVPYFLQECANHCTLAVASFNPDAQNILREWGLYHHFSSGRFGSNFPWHSEYDESMRDYMDKSGMILHMIANELSHPEKFDQIVFFDDNPGNIREVNENAPSVKTELVNSNLGITWDNIKKFLPTKSSQ